MFTSLDSYCPFAPMLWVLLSVLSSDLVEEKIFTLQKIYYDVCVLLFSRQIVKS